MTKKMKKKKTETLIEEEEGEGGSEARSEIIEQGEVAEEAAVVEKGLEEEGEELEMLQEELKEAKAQAAEYLDGWQRTQAEFSNYKKRQEAERAQVMVLANAALLRKLLPIVDDFERAIATLPTDLERLTWCEGIFLIQHKLVAFLESEGVKPIETEGQAFDPHCHDAVTHEDAPGYEEGQIIGEVQRGYILGERVLRPALVRVAKAPVAPEPELSEG